MFLKKGQFINARRQTKLYAVKYMIHKFIKTHIHFQQVFKGFIVSIST